MSHDIALYSEITSKSYVFAIQIWTGTCASCEGFHQD